MPKKTQTPTAAEYQKKTILEEILSGLPPRVGSTLQKFLREILAGIIIVVLAVSLWSGYSAYTTRQENRAAAAMGAAMQQTDTAKRISALEKVIHNHGYTNAGRHALLFLGATQRDSGQIEAAKKSFDMAKQELPKDSFLYYSALMGLGYLQEDNAELDKARRAYKSASVAQQGFEAVASLDLARVFSDLGYNDKAIESYNKYLSMKPQSPQTGFVRHQIMKLSFEDKRPGEISVLGKKDGE